MQVNELASSRRASVVDAFNPWTSLKCPIDRYYEEVLTARAFYARVEGALSLPSTPLLKTDLPTLREMVFLRCVTAFEDYLKLLIGMSVSVLPCCQEATRTHQIPMSAVLAYPKDRVGLGLVEGKSLSDSSDLQRRLEAYMAVKIENQALDSLFTDLDLVLQLRHCLVHSLGILSAHDASKVHGMTKIGQRVDISYDLFTDCMAVIDRAVRALNQTVFNRIEQRWWVVNSVLTGDAVNDLPMFSALIKIFWSEQDMGTLDIPALYAVSKSEWYPRVPRRTGS